MKNNWIESKSENYQQYKFLSNKEIKYTITVSISNGINYFISLNDKFKNYKKFLKIEDKINLETKIKIVDIVFLHYFTDEVIYEKKLYSKKKSLNESLEEKDFYVFNLSPDGRSIEWGKFLFQEIEDYVNLCKKQVELWEE